MNKLVFIGIAVLLLALLWNAESPSDYADNVEYSDSQEDKTDYAIAKSKLEKLISQSKRMEDSWNCCKSKKDLHKLSSEQKTALYSWMREYVAAYEFYTNNLQAIILVDGDLDDLGLEHMLTQATTYEAVKKMLAEK